MGASPRDKKEEIFSSGITVVSSLNQQEENPTFDDDAEQSCKLKVERLNLNCKMANVVRQTKP